MAACLAAPVIAVAADATPKPATVVVEQQQSCASVVIRHCRLQYVPERHVDGDDAHPATDIPGHWEAVRNAAYDDEEIFVEGQALRDPNVREVFRRYFGASGTGHAYVTHIMRGGSRCTTDTSTGVRLCSKPGSEAPAPFISTDFSDTVF